MSTLLSLEKVVERVSRRAIDKVSFIGAGNMAYAIASGLLRQRVGQSPQASLESPSQISVYAPSDRNLPKFRDLLKCQTYTSLSEASIDQSDLVFICVKPQVLTSYSAQKPFLSLLSSSPIIVSAAAGVTINSLKRYINCPEGTYVRLMTSTACSIGQAICATTIDSSIEEERQNDLRALLSSFLSPLGEVAFVEESHLDTITAVGASGPAFGLMFLQSMSDGAVKCGLPRHLATKLAAYSLRGAASMVLETGEHPMSLRDKICSPGGTTIHGIHALERNSVSAGIMECIEEATKRARELSG